MPQIPKSKSGQLADLLRERVLEGGWSGQLPAERILAEEFLVSRTTLRKAISVLVSEDIATAATTTRSGRSLKPTAKSGTGSTIPQVVVLTPSLSGSPVLSGQLAVLRETLGPVGLQVHVHEAGALVEQDSPEAGLRRIVARRPGAIWVLHRMPRSVHEVFASMKLSVVVFGSTFAEILLPSVDIDFKAVGRHAAGLCIARGCKSIALLIHRTYLAGDAMVTEAVRETLDRHGVASPLIIRHDFNRSRLMDGLDHAFVTGKAACDALLIANQHHLLTALPHLMRRGVRIPEDLSLVYLSNDPVIERLSPLPYRYDCGPALVKKLATAIKAIATGEVSGSHQIIPKMLAGETLRAGLKERK
jgi:DNA-binding LacI/PurR family transcriptional regulator